ncbi:hypothetical protein PTTG_25611 [Puccinia triticina 1-1 BBBD Race 1]|uniref:DUF6589 domain-containing protein n=1 Tax=Puccinia triticina (isolate 1-1 / race 1 (BBBD)) TaxID=630390 RepID=A0A180H238_PUCT1|nr:hypothetical protein PTTG_25611 [Puccinia triticina 1-1 BBBD Race 1]
MAPKSFLLHFLCSTNSQISYRRRYWAKSGIDSTMGLLNAVSDEIKRSPPGRKAWEKFIQEQAIEILASQKPPKGNYPKGSFQSSEKVKQSFFTQKEKDRREDLLTSTHTPFLCNILMGALQKQQEQKDKSKSKDDDGEPEGPIEKQLNPEDTPPDQDVVAYSQLFTGEGKVHFRFHRIVTTVCSMVSSASNCLANGLQLVNSVRLLSCGVLERVHKYLNFIGLSSSRWTALTALDSLAKEAKAKLRLGMALKSGIPVAPTICIDNIDMVKKVHALSVGNRTHTFRGTWGYIHLPNPELLRSLDLDELALPEFYQAMELADSAPIEPQYFLPTADSNIVEEAVWKSQIAHVLRKYIAIPANNKSALPINPPIVDQISHEKPDIQMLKLMDASDNCAEGVGQVFKSILSQSGLSEENFFGRLQPMDGDLGTVQNFNCLRSQRTPNPFPQECLDNCFFQLGAAHTLWNVASAIFTHHFGNSSDSLDCGAWQFLEALGFPAEKAIQKKDFTLMINQMECVHESILFYCLRVITKTTGKAVPQSPEEISTEDWNALINKCYNMFCSSEARRTAAARKCPKLHNTLVMLHDFSSVVEASRAMKAGDVGRLMIVWKKWCFMTRSLSGSTNYSSYLPRMVLVLTVILPAALRKYLQHNLLFSPTGRKDHFVAKDFWLEIQNS